MYPSVPRLNKKFVLLLLIFYLSSFVLGLMFIISFKVTFLCVSFQMSAYFAPAFFSHLLGKCLRRKNPLLEVLKLGLVVMGIFAIVWWPYIHSKDAFFEVKSSINIC